MHVYWFQDSKQGHINQVKVLLDELARDADLDFQVSAISCKSNWLQRMLQRFGASDKISPKTNMVMLIGAGHGTYPSILEARKILQKSHSVLTVAVLKPSRNIQEFDVVYAPAHDFYNELKPTNVTTFMGSLAPTSEQAVDSSQAIICLGGNSHHYKFDTKIAIKQIAYLLMTHPTLQFSIFNSRRTPAGLTQQITELNEMHKNYSFYDHISVSNTIFMQKLHASNLKFITPDSVNLVFEALSSPGKTYLMQIESPLSNVFFKKKKIRRLMVSLVRDRHVGVVKVRDELSNKVLISSIEQPSLYFEPLEEVKKVAFALKKIIQEKL